MSQETYNDVTITWTPYSGQAVSIPHTNCTVDDGAGEVPTAAVGDTGHTFKDGIAAPSVTVSFNGSGAGLVLGSVGSLAIAGMAGSLANCRIFDKSVDGGEDSPIQGSVLILPGPSPLS